MRKNNYAAVMIGMAMLALVPGCGVSESETKVAQTTEAMPEVSFKPAINFEGTVSEVQDDLVTLEDGTKIRITKDTQFAGDPDTNNSVNSEILPGNYIQGYSEDSENGKERTAQNIWTNLSQETEEAQNAEK